MGLQLAGGGELAPEVGNTWLLEEFCVQLVQRLVEVRAQMGDETQPKFGEGTLEHVQNEGFKPGEGGDILHVLLAGKDAILGRERMLLRMQHIGLLISSKARFHHRHRREPPHLASQAEAAGVGNDGRPATPTEPSTEGNHRGRVHHDLEILATARRSIETGSTPFRLALAHCWFT